MKILSDLPPYYKIRWLINGFIFYLQYKNDPILDYKISLKQMLKCFRGLHQVKSMGKSHGLATHYCEFRPCGRYFADETMLDEHDRSLINELPNLRGDKHE